MSDRIDRPSRRSRLKRWGVRFLVVLGALNLVLILFIALGALLVGREGVPGRTILELDLERGLVEYVADDPIAQALGSRATSVRDVVEALHRAATDDRVVALVARVGAGDLGAAQVEEIRDAVAVFRAAGKPAVLFSETFGEVGSGMYGYYLATAFDEIYLQPSGDVGLTGIVVETPFFRGTLDQLDVEPRIDHRHEYKNIMNTFTERGFTPAHREATEAIAESVFGSVVRAISAARGLPEEQVRALVDRGPLLGDEALRAGLVDGLRYRDEVFDSLRARFDGAELLFLPQYLSRAGRPYDRGETIALIYGVGNVQRGTSDFSPVFGGSAMGAETVTRAFHRAIEDPSVRAIVFRIDSPGGSFVASDAIWREVVRARAAGKPVIATMGNTAASGGYYVAMAADRIIAQPSTLTGSIGVVFGKPVTRELWNRFGVTFDEVQRGDNATMWSTLHDYSPEEWARVQAWLDRVYLEFTTKAAEGRGMPHAQLEPLARGRVWTGADAQRLGLVDDLGGLTLAIDRAREAAGIAADARVQLRVFPEERTLLQSVLDRGPESSRPEAAIALHLLEAVRPALRLAEQAGVLGPAGTLTMPPLRLR